MAPAVEWKFWMSDENAAKAESNTMMKNYFANVKKTFAGIESKVTPYEWGKEVAPGITEADLEALALADPAVVAALGGAAIRKVIVRAPKLVNIVI